MFEPLKRIFLRHRPPVQVYDVELDPHEKTSYCVRVTFPNGCIKPNDGYSARLLWLALEVVEETSFEVLRKEQIDNYVDAGDTRYEYRGSNLRPNVLALLACNLTWSDHARLLALKHAIPDDEVAAIRERMEERSPFLRWPNTDPPE